MTYAKNNKIEAADFNDSLVGVSGTSTVGLLNASWNRGSGSLGYGQAAVPPVAIDDTILHDDWANLVNTINAIAHHQGTVIPSVTVPVEGLPVDYNSTIINNLNTISDPLNRLCANGQGITHTTFANALNSWNTELTFTHTVSFANGDAARFFFNSGGQLALNFSSPSGTGINGLVSNMANACGTVVMSSIGGSGNITINGTVYQGVTKVGGLNTGSPEINSTYGYFNQSTSNVEIFKQKATGTPTNYIGSYISITTNSSGQTIGGVGDTGNVITFYTYWNEDPDGLTVAPGTSTALTVRYPKDSGTGGYIANSWGAVNVTYNVSGS